MSSSRGDSAPAALLAAARTGGGEHLGRLLEVYRTYLKLLARTQLSLHLQARVNPSDIVQETFLEAYRDFPQFRGNTEAEFLAWLRRILVNNLARLCERHMQAKKRDVRCELSLEQLGALVDRSSARMESLVAATTSSPSASAQRQERATMLAEHLSQLSEDHRQVIVLRHLEDLPFDEVGQRMGRTSGAVRMLWLRAIDQLRRNMNEEHLP